MTKLEILNEIETLTKLVEKESSKRIIARYKKTGIMNTKDGLYNKMDKEVYAKNLEGRYYIIKATKKATLENLLKDLINFCYDNNIISSAYDY